MIITRLELDSFRNLQRQRIELSPRFNLLYGVNGAGKTNVLEAVMVLGTLRSFRAGRTSELLRFGSERAWLRGDLEEAGLRDRLELELHAHGRRALLNGKPVKTSARYLGKLVPVLFSPEDLQIPRGAPGERRKLLDRAIAGSWPAYYEVMRSFQRALQTRNRVLREKGPRQEELLAVYDRQVAELGSRVVASRRRYVRALGNRVEAVFGELSRSGARAGLRYLSHPELNGVGDGLGELEIALAGLLRRARPLDLLRQVTTVGPQSDDLEFQLDGRPARAYGSQGQLRSLVLSFKISQIMDTYARLGSYPVLLLDDVSSELDPEKNSYLFEFVKEIGCQTFVTTTRPELLPITENVLKLHMVDGSIEGASRA